MSNIFNETLSLAALFQSCAQIQRIARTGQGDESAMAPVIRGLIITNPKSCEVDILAAFWIGNNKTAYYRGHGAFIALTCSCNSLDLCT